MKKACEKCIKFYRLDENKVTKTKVGDNCYWCYSKKYKYEDKSDYAYVDGELFLRDSSVVEIVFGSPNFASGEEKEFLEQDLGIDKDGRRV